MTILAGVYSRNPGIPVPDAACESLRRNISRHSEDRPIELRNPRACFVKVDIGAYGRPAHRVSPAGSIAMLAGEPLLARPGPKSEERDVQLEFLQDRLESGELQALRSASGTFCAAFYDPRTDTLRLVADRLGLRPLYYAVVGDMVYFASALRILEALEQVPKTMDVLSVIEMAGFGYPFAGGTPYSGITMLQACEIVTARGNDIVSSRYFQWDSITRSTETQAESLRSTFEKFQSAVRRRLRGDGTVFAYLSGGLDSRCVVAALRSEGAKVYTFNLSPPGTQDQVFGLQFAEKLGTTHREVPVGPDPDWSGVMAAACNETLRAPGAKPERPKAVWSGEGGSVGLGHCYFTPEIVSLLQAGKEDDAIGVFLRQQGKGILTTILASRLTEGLRGHLHSGMRKELAAIRQPDRVRALYIFLNINGPRRHLEDHFDAIDTHRIEFQMPFNDSDFLEHVASHAAEPFLYHEFYTRWLSLFDPAVLAVAWQAYPGHVRSTVPVPTDVLDQWTSPYAAEHERSRRRELLKRSSALLSRPDFPHPVLHRRHLQLMWWAWKLNLRRYDYALKTALVYGRYWNAAGGKHELPSSS